MRGVVHVFAPGEEVDVNLSTSGRHHGRLDSARRQLRSHCLDFQSSTNTFEDEFAIAHGVSRCESTRGRMRCRDSSEAAVH